MEPTLITTGDELCLRRDRDVFKKLYEEFGPHQSATSKTTNRGTRGRSHRRTTSNCTLVDDIETERTTGTGIADMIPKFQIEPFSIHLDWLVSEERDRNSSEMTHRIITSLFHIPSTSVKLRYTPNSLTENTNLGLNELSNSNSYKIEYHSIPISRGIARMTTIALTKFLFKLSLSPQDRNTTLSDEFITLSVLTEFGVSLAKEERNQEKRIKELQEIASCGPIIITEETFPTIRHSPDIFRKYSMSTFVSVILPIPEFKQDFLRKQIGKGEKEFMGRYCVVTEWPGDLRCENFEYIV